MPYDSVYVARKSKIWYPSNYQQQWGGVDNVENVEGDRDHRSVNMNMNIPPNMNTEERDKNSNMMRAITMMMRRNNTNNNNTRRKKRKRTGEWLSG